MELALWRGWGAPNWGAGMGGMNWFEPIIQCLEWGVFKEANKIWQNGKSEDETPFTVIFYCKRKIKSSTLTQERDIWVRKTSPRKSGVDSVNQ